MKKLFARSSKTTKPEGQTLEKSTDSNPASSPPSTDELGVVTTSLSANTTPASSLSTSGPRATIGQIPAATHNEATPLARRRNADAPRTPPRLETPLAPKELNPDDMTIIVNNLKLDEHRAHGFRGEDPGETRYAERHSATFRVPKSSLMSGLWTKILGLNSPKIVYIPISTYLS